MSPSPVAPEPKNVHSLEQRWLWDRYAEWLRRRFPLPLFITLLFSAFAVGGFFQEPAPRFAGIKSLEARDPRTREAEEIRKEIGRSFGVQRPDLFLVFETPRDPQREDIRAIRAAIAALREEPVVDQALWIDDVPAVNLFQLTRSILPADTISIEGFEEEMRKVADHPLATGQLVSLDGRDFLVPIRIDWLAVESDTDLRDGLLRTARRAMSRVPNQQVSIDATGDIPLYLDQLAAHRRNQSRFQWIGYSLVLVVATLMYRSPVPVILVALAPATGIFWATSALRWMGEPANPLSDSVLPILVAIVGVTDGVHLLAHYRDALAQGLGARAAAAKAIEEVAHACFLTSLTTAIGFLSLLWADSELIRGFGRSCAVGVSLAFIAMLTVFPLVASWSWVGRRVPAAKISGRGTDLLEWVLSPFLRRSRVVALIGIGVTVVMSSLLVGLEGDEKRAYGLPSSSPAFQTLQRVDAAFGGIETGQILVTWTERWDDSEELLRVLAEVDQAVHAQPVLGRSLSLTEVSRTMTMAPGSGSFDFVALIPSALRQALYQPRQRQAVVSFRLPDLGVAELEPVFGQVESELSRISAAHPGIELGLTGDGVVRGRRVVRVIDDLKYSLLAAAVVIFSLLAIVLRSWKLGLIAIVPNLFPVAASASALILVGRHLDISAACAFTVCLGIAVDDTIHFLARYQRERELGHDTATAVRLSIHKVGLSLVATTAIMSIGFATVLLSEMPGQRIFGAMAVCTITSALAADLILLPAILLLVDRGKTIEPAPTDS